MYINSNSGGIHATPDFLRIEVSFDLTHDKERSANNYNIILTTTLQNLFDGPCNVAVLYNFYPRDSHGVPPQLVNVHRLEMIGFYKIHPFGELFQYISAANAILVPTSSVNNSKSFFGMVNSQSLE